MGLFDTVVLEIDDNRFLNRFTKKILHEKLNDIYFQTKSLGSNMVNYLIDRDGRFRIDDGPYLSNFSGNFEIYQMSRGYWFSFMIYISRGWLSNITVQEIKITQPKTINIINIILEDSVTFENENYLRDILKKHEKSRH